MTRENQKLKVGLAKFENQAKYLKEKSTKYEHLSKSAVIKLKPIKEEVFKLRE